MPVSAGTDLGISGSSAGFARLATAFHPPTHIPVVRSAYPAPAGWDLQSGPRTPHQLPVATRLISHPTDASSRYVPRRYTIPASAPSTYSNERSATCKGCLRNPRRYGGLRLYHRLRPFFVGLILGEFIMIGFWTLVDAIAGARRFMPYGF